MTQIEIYSVFAFGLSVVLILLFVAPIASWIRWPAVLFFSTVALPPIVGYEITTTQN